MTLCSGGAFTLSLQLECYLYAKGDSALIHAVSVACRKTAAGLCCHKARVQFMFGYEIAIISAFLGPLAQEGLSGAYLRVGRVLALLCCQRISGFSLITCVQYDSTGRHNY